MYAKLCLIGGDLRAKRLAVLLRARGYAADTLGVEQGDEQRAKLASADALLFAYPRSACEGKVPTLTGLTLHARDALTRACDGALVLHGSGLEDALTDAEIKGKRLRTRRYDDDEAFLNANAAISAEAAVFEAMKRTEHTLEGMSVVVTGYGRFGRALAKRLLALGATVWIGARRAEALQLAASDGMKALRYHDLPLIVGRAQMLLNTVPAHVLTTETLEALHKSTLILELASAPYAASREQIRARGLQYEILPALPAKYAPASAANALLMTVEKTLSEVEA